MVVHAVACHHRSPQTNVFSKQCTGTNVFNSNHAITSHDYSTFTMCLALDGYSVVAS
eukprot:m.1060841 g.1060841  ORF g.1060841 m.1060841 type:complete len:57 (-) comp24209_c0_seq107:1970-2140(-)